MMHGGYGMFGGGGLLGLIIIVIVGYLFIKYFDENRNNANTFSRKSNAIDLLNERYAKGEIDEEEYTKRKNVLKD